MCSVPFSRKPLTPSLSQRQKGQAESPLPQQGEEGEDEGRRGASPHFSAQHYVTRNFVP